MLSFVLITEAKINISKGMDGEEGTETQGLTEEEAFQPSNELLTVLHDMKPC